jgi:hypothetical protein
MGIALTILILPVPTRATTIEVVTDELCTNEVARMPMKSPTRGLEVVLINWLTNPPPNNFKELPRRFMHKRKV